MINDYLSKSRIFRAGTNCSSILPIIISVESANGCKSLITHSTYTYIVYITYIFPRVWSGEFNEK
jgi:hypothetical protein